MTTTTTMTMTMSVRCSAWLVCVAWACAACRVGAPLVGEKEPLQPPGGRGLSPCITAPLCVTTPLELGDDDLMAEPIAIDICGGLPECSSTSNDGTLPCEETDGVTDLPQFARCSSLTWRAPSGVSEVTLDQAVWSDFNVSLSSERRVTVTLHAPLIHGVFVQLTGPVTLRFVEAPGLEDLRIAGTQQSRVELDRASVSALRVGNDDDSPRRFEGELSLVATVVDSVGIHGGSVEIESTSLSTGEIHVGRMQALDAEFFTTDVELDSGSMSSFKMRDSRLHVCDEVSVVEGHINASAVSTCDSGLVRLYSSSVVGSSLDGSYELDTTTVLGTRYGVSTPTKIRAYAAEMTAVRLCDFMEEFAIVSNTSLICSECDMPESVPEFTCLQPDADRRLQTDSNFCPALLSESGPALPTCSDEVLQRRRALKGW